jgi:hypothetical protein
MSDQWLFFLDADGWLVGPESAPFPDEANAIQSAYRALRDDDDMMLPADTEEPARS